MSVTMHDNFATPFLSCFECLCQLNRMLLVKLNYHKPLRTLTFIFDTLIEVLPSAKKIYNLQNLIYNFLFVCFSDRRCYRFPISMFLSRCSPLLHQLSLILLHNHRLSLYCSCLPFNTLLKRSEHALES